MKTQYFLMLSGSYGNQTKRLVCILNAVRLSSFSLVANPRADQINTVSQHRPAHLQVTNAQPGMSCGIESLLELEAAYRCALDNALNKNTPSA